MQPDATVSLGEEGGRREPIGRVQLTRLFLRLAGIESESMPPRKKADTAADPKVLVTVTQKMNVGVGFALLKRGVVSDVMYKARISKVLRAAKANGGSLDVTYTLPAGAFGRLHAMVAGSEFDVSTAAPACYMWHQIRNPMAHGIYQGVDIEAAAHTILAQLFDRHDIEHDCLTDLLEHREVRLTELMEVAALDRRGAKALINKLTNGGSLRGISNAPQWAHDLKAEFDINAATMASLPDYAEIKAYAVSTREAKREAGKDVGPSDLGSIMSYIYQEYERRLLLAAINAAIDDGFSIGALINDGFHAEAAAGQITDEHLARWAKAAARVTGIRVRFVIKRLEGPPQDLVISDDDDDDNDDDRADRIDDHLKRVTDGPTDRALADLAHAVFGHDYATVYDSKSDKPKWFTFAKHRWHCDGVTAEVVLRLTDDIKPFFDKEITCYRERIAVTTDKDEKKRMKSVIANMEKVVTKLATSRDQCNIMKQLAALLKRPYLEFEAKLDSKPNLLGFENGVLDLDAGEAGEFRAGRPDDLITLSTCYDFPEHGSCTEARIFLTRMMSDIFPNDNTRAYMMKTLAYYLHGDKRFENSNIQFWTGTGANGKGVTSVLKLITLGEYGLVLDPKALTGQGKDAAAASPQWAAIRGKRLVVLSEPNEGTQIQGGQLKQITGGDKLSIRDLYKPQVEIVVQAGFVFQTNTKPDLAGFDGGVGRRVNVVPFNTTFTVTPDVSRGQRHLDENLKTRIKNDIALRQEFILMLLDSYVEHDLRAPTARIVRPEQIEAATASYLDDNNQVLAFIRDKLENSDELGCFVLSSAMYGAWRSYAASRDCKAHGTNWLKDQLAINGHEVEKKTTRGEGHMCMVYWGLKLRVFASDS
jgi:P4 family phage/plasmid primase-like protien